MKINIDTSSSTSIKSCEYNDITLDLIVEFNSGKYCYKNVDYTTFTELASAKSLGNFIATRLRSFTTEKIDDHGVNNIYPPGKSDLWPFPTNSKP